MYFYGRRYLWSADDLSKQETIISAFPELAGFQVKSIDAELCYWRKFNALH